MSLAAQWGETIPVGVIYENDRLPFEERLSALSEGALVGREADRAALRDVMARYA